MVVMLRELYIILLSRNEFEIKGYKRNRKYRLWPMLLGINFL